MADGKSFWSLQIGKSKPKGTPTGDLVEAPTPSPKSPAPSKKPRRSTKGTSIMLGTVLIVVLAAAAAFYLVPRFTSGESPTESTSARVVADKTGATTRATSTTTSSTIPATTTTVAGKTTTISVVRLHNSYRTTGYFSFPGSWSAFSLETEKSAAFFEQGGQRIAVGDLTEAYRGDQPRNEVQFIIWTIPEDKTLPTPYAMVSGSITTPWGAPKSSLQSARTFTVNGYDAADRVFRVMDGKTAIDIREVAVISGRTACGFFMCAEEKNKAKYWPIFDQILASLDLTTNKVAP